MVTHEQYLAAKRIIEQYEHEQELQGWDDEDEDYDERDWVLEEEERQEEEDFERASSCTCGAWIINKNGKGVHVADCYCGAE